jgi:threonine aldolase
LLGIQFDALLTDNIYFEIAAKANKQADQIRSTLDNLGYSYVVPTVTNQIFSILPDELLNELGKEFAYSEMDRIDENHRSVRFCTSWATKQENVDALCRKLTELSK